MLVRLLSLLSGLICLQVLAQNAQLSGVVRNKDTQETLPNASIRLLSATTQYGVVTDFDGLYTIAVPPDRYELICTYVGLTEQRMELSLGANEVRTLDFNLVENDALLDPVVITGSKFEQKLSEQTVSMEVIKPALVDNINSTSADQTIQKVPGVVVVDQQANIRGGSGFSYGAGSRVLLLMDDLPILTADLGFPRWDFLPIENLEQIEIIKGASSALYGSAAMNGIINMRTAYPKSEPVTKIALFNNIYQNPRNNQVIHYSPDGTPTDTVQKSWWGNEQPYERGATFAHRQRYGQFDLVMGSYLYDKKSFRATEFERRGRANVNMRYRFKNVPGLSIGLNSNYQAVASGTFLIWNGIDEKAYQIWGLNDTIENRTYLLTVDPFIEYFNAATEVKQKLVMRYYQNNNHTTQNRTTLSDLYYGEYQFQKRFSKADMVVTAGLVTSAAFVEAELYTGGNHKFRNFGGYVQADKKIMQRMNVSIGARYEHNRIDTLASEAKPVLRAGMNYELTRATFIRASYGEAYRFPSISEKFLNTYVGSGGAGFSIGVFPNPELRSETGWSAELGIKQGFKVSEWKGFGDVAVFISEYNNMMEFSFGTPASPIGNYPGIGYKSLNVGDTRIWGIDCSVVGQGSLLGMPTNILAGYTYVDPTYRTFDSLQRSQSTADYNVLKYRNRHIAKIDAETTIHKLTVGLSYQYLSFMEAIDIAFNLAMPGVKTYREQHDGGTSVWGARLSYIANKSFSMSFICNNLTNLEYAISPVKIEAPRNFTLRLNYNFDYSEKKNANTKG
ncbi:MAG: TonB-dependent receptor [Chitinophagales bacterium]|jgi:iron complex outermembrane receptor protein|nr:TonB-dependent receptor [Chitinophagales bacterium]